MEFMQNTSTTHLPPRQVFQQTSFSGENKILRIPGSEKYADMSRDDIRQMFPGTIKQTRTTSFSQGSGITPPSYLAGKIASKTQAVYLVEPTLQSKAKIFCLKIHHQEGMRVEFPEKILIPLEWSVIGRSPDFNTAAGTCIIVPHPSVSRQHGMICCENGMIYVYDLKSVNGTQIVRHSKLIKVEDEPMQVIAGDYIAFGHVLFAVSEV